DLRLTWVAGLINLLVRRITVRSREEYADATHTSAVLVDWHAAGKGSDSAPLERSRGGIHCLAPGNHRVESRHVRRRIESPRIHEGVAIRVLDVEQIGNRRIGNSRREVPAQTDRAHSSRSAGRRGRIVVDGA